MRLALIAVGKLRDAWVREGCDVYLTRLRPRLRTEVIEVKDGADLLRAVPPRFRVWALDEHGVEVTSVELSQRLQRERVSGAPGLALLIGAADGLPKDTLASADLRLSLSRLTLPHRLVRVVALEQIYRALSIIHDEPYHRE